MSEIREISTQFEAVKIAMTQDKNGHILKLAIHPNDTPEDIMRDPVGSRYLVVLVRMNEQGEPVASEQSEDGRKAVMLAGTLCSDDNFQEWLSTTGAIDEMTEGAATMWLRKRLGITSRKELKTDREARQRLLGVRDEFMYYMRNNR